MKYLTFHSYMNFLYQALHDGCMILVLAVDWKLPVTIYNAQNCTSVSCRKIYLLESSKLM